MAGEAALTKFKWRLLDWLDGQIGAGVAVFIDRPFDQPFRDEDLDCVNIRVPQVDFMPHSYSQGMQHDLTVAFDIIVASSPTQSISESQAEIAAAIVDRLADMDGTSGSLGELLTSQNTGLLATPVSLGQQQDDMGLSDHGENVFAWRFSYLTPIGDFRTIVGQSGLIA